MATKDDTVVLLGNPKERFGTFCAKASSEKELYGNRRHLPRYFEQILGCSEFYIHSSL